MPIVFVSYSHDSPVHRNRILDLSDRLRADGVDCRIDQYHQFPAEGWPVWCANQVEESDFVLVACTETYIRRFKGQDAPHIGLGGTWEGHIIAQELYNARGRNTKFIPILWTIEDAVFVPLPLQSASHFQLPNQYDNLYRLLTSQPFIPLPPLGSLKTMPAREHPSPLPHLERKQDFQTVWHTPFARNPFFTGRETIMDGLHDTLEQQKSAAISGGGGMGKTQTAIEYAYRYRVEYKAVLWAKAESRETLLADSVSIARALGLPSSEAREQELAIAEVRDWLETNPGWLLILDNADDLTLVKELLPQNHQGHLLLTTRAHALAGLAERLSIAGMQPEEGSLLLLRRAGLCAKASPADQSVALQISQELGGLPLALDQAAAFVEETPCTLSDYLETYHSEKGKLLAERGSLSDHPSVSVTFSLAFEKVVVNSAAAADLIRLCAFLAPDAIPEGIVTAGADVLGENLGSAARSALEFAKVLREAGRFSLLNRDPQNKTLSIHRLVQVVVQAGMTAEDQRQWAERALRAVGQAFPAVEFRNWAVCQKLLPHAQECASLIDQWEFQSEEAAALVNKTALYLQDRGLLAQAEPFFRFALVIWEKVFGLDHPDVAASLNNLATLYDRQGQYAEAEPLFLRALAIFERTLEPDHPHIATSLNNLANLYHNQGQYSQAESLYRRALGIRKKSLGPDHLDVANSLNNLAELYRDQGQYAAAEPLYQHALVLYENALGRDHPDVATCLNNLAILYKKQDRHADAERLYRRALAIRENALGPDHPDTAMSFHNLAVLHYSQGQHSEAEPLYLRALAAFEKAVGPNHPDVARSSDSLAVLYCDQHRYAEAEPLHERALAIRENTLGPDHPDVALTLNNLATLYYRQGRYNEADRLYRRALGIRDKAP